MIKVAKTAGFCYGVKRAVDEVYKKIDEGEKICTLGNLIHNRQVVRDLEEKGVFSYSNLEEIPENVKAVIRTHGVGKNIIDSLKEKNIEYFDLTCPFVAKIHRIVYDNYKDGKKIIIVGDENHPEVVGINGWCNNEAFILYSENVEIPEEFIENECCVVAQTTINREIFGKIVHFIKKTCKRVYFFDTICNATKCRQEEAESLARECDLMIVVGGRESSNTAKLFEISKQHCEESYHIETASELPEIYTKNKKIGITAGASTPGGIIEEVVRSMGEIKKEENFAELFEQYGTKTLNNGDIVDGVVVEVRNTEVIVDLGVKYNGQLAADQLTEDPTVKPSDIVKPGDSIKVYVVGVNDSEGKVVLSRKKIVQQESWNKVKAAFDAGEVLEGKVIKAVNGGVIALADQQQIFIPARQASEHFVQDLQTLVGTTVAIKLIEVDERRKRVVGSVRVLLEEARKEREAAFWAAAEVGKRYDGVVKSLTNFGAFVDIGGVDGLVHISELSWNKIKHPSEIVSVGDTVDVYIKDMNAETKKISLGFKKAEDNPWVIAKEKLSEGAVVNCKIVRIVPFGAFAEIIPTIDGLIHISEIDTKRIEKPEDVLSIGQEVEAKVIAINWDEKKISLSMKALIEPEVAEEPVEVAEEPAADEPEEALVYSTDPEVEVEASVEVETEEE